MPDKQQIKTSTLRYALAYAGTLALVATVAFFPAAVNETVVAQLRGFSFAQETVATSGQLSVQSSRTTTQNLSSWLLFLVLFGACLAKAAEKNRPRFVSIVQLSYRACAIQKSHYLIPEIRGPSL